MEPRRIFAVHDLQFVDLLKLGDSQAYEKLYHSYVGLIEYTIWRIVKIDSIIEDLTQDTFIKIFKAIHQYEPGKGKLNTWIMSIARNTAKDYMRSKYHIESAKNAELYRCANEVDAQYHVQLDVDVFDVQSLLSMLTLQDRWIFSLCFLQGFSHPEAAQKLRLPLGTLKYRIRRAKQLLRDCL